MFTSSAADAELAAIVRGRAIKASFLICCLNGFRIVETPELYLID